MRVTFGSATELASSLLESCGMPEGNARRTAWALVAADAWGRGSHGLLRLPFYLARLEAGGTNPSAELKVVADRGPALCLDGDNGLGHWQVWAAATEAASRAERWGLAAVSVGNSGHCGALGLYLLPILERRLAGLVLSHGPAVIPPWGGSKPVTSTSPLAVGLPTAPRPTLVDLACSSAARGRIAEAARAGRPLPEGWALDSAGQPTTDPTAALQGMLAPLGGAKGFALALAVEGLTAGLVGPRLSTEVADPLDPAVAGEPQALAHLVIAIDPAAFDVDGQALKRLRALAESVESAGGRLPGAAHPLEAELGPNHELELPAGLIDQLRSEARQRQLGLPQGWQEER